MLRTFVCVWLIVQPSSPFVFQNNFWVYLHQHLLAEATVARGAGATGQAGGAVSSDLYADLARRDPILDRQLTAINDALARVTSDASSLPRDLGIDPAVSAALNLAAPPIAATPGRGSGS